MERDCQNCIRSKGVTEYDNGCTSWDCDYINRTKAIKIYEAYKNIVRCKDCKHYDTESRTFPCCTDIFGAVRYMEADGFCSKGEPKGE